MNTLITILLAINIVDLVVFPFYMVWIIRRGIWLYDFQQFHRVFHLVQLLFFVYAITHMVPIDFGTRLLFAVYIATALQHNFSLHQFLSPNAMNGGVFQYRGPSALRYFGLLKNNAEVLAWIYNDISEKGVFADPEEYDIVCRHSGRAWGFVNYAKNYGVRLVCDGLAVVALLVILA